MNEFPKPRALAAIMLALLVPAIPFAVLGELPGEHWLDASGSDAAGFALVGVALLASDIALPVPSSVIMTLLGGRLGWPAGWLAATLGLTAGNLAGFGLGRLALSRLGAALPRDPTLALVAITRPVPLVAEAVCIAAGASGMRLSRFAGVSVLANALMAAVLVAVGAALLPSGATPFGLAIAVAVPALAWWVWRRSSAAL